jgi:thiol-disulfide isomerase/thioredoxin
VNTKVQLLVSEWCAPCRGAEEVWRQAAQRKDFVFEVLDVGQPEGRAIVARHAVKTVPASVVDDTLKHVGIPTLAQALEFVSAAPDRSARRAEYVGLTLGATSRWAIAASAIYLVLAGAALVFGDGIAGAPPWRSASLHLFGLGFVTFAVFGFGEHMLPRFVGSPIRGGWPAWIQQALAHAGTLLLVAGLTGGGSHAALAGGLVASCGLTVFAARIWPVIAGAGVGHHARG